MSNVNVATALQAAIALTPEERQELRGILDGLPADTSSMTPDELVDHILLQRGVISRIPPPITDAGAYQRYEPVTIQGKPLSETIVEERR